LCFRVRNIALTFGPVNPSGHAFPESLLSSIALFLIMIGAVWTAWPHGSSTKGMAGVDQTRRSDGS
jgi:hypothetical protein